MDRSFIETAIRSAFTASLNSGSFVDTAYYAFTSRRRDGVVTTPRVIYANSAVLKAAGEYFAAQLSGGFDTQQREQTSTDTYSYEDDSDLEDCEDDTDDDQPDEWEKLGSSPKASIADEERKGNADLHTAEAVLPAKDAETSPHIQYSVVLPDVAANTWQALIYYIYTGEVHFAPLKSRAVARRRKTAKYRKAYPDRPALCSPKSMYRLADIVGFEELKNLAKEDILVNLSPAVAVKEVFSRFSSIYPDVLDVQLRFLYDADAIPAAMPQLQEKLKAVAEGRLPHAESVLTALVLKLSTLLVGESADPTAQSPLAIADRDADSDTNPPELARDAI